MRQSRHVAIAGGGIIGLSCALLLRQRGLEVTVLEAGAAMKEASWAAGGMLAVEDPENPPALLSLSRYSRSVYDVFLKVIQELSGRSISFRTSETVQWIGPPRAVAGSARLTQAVSPVAGVQPGEHPFLLLQETSLDPRDLCAALPLAVRAAGVSLREDEPVTSIEQSGDGVRVTTRHGTLEADAFVNCCGAWAGILDRSAGIIPRKGQMLVVEQPDTSPLTRVLRSPDVYLIPRGDGRIVIGATVEDAGYSKDVQTEALMLLQQRAAALWRPAQHARQLDSWAGLRPGTVDDLPIIGPCTEAATAQFIAAGHHRNGILLAPGTAHVIADLVCNATPAVDLAPFAPHRPSISAVCDKQFAAAL